MEQISEWRKNKNKISNERIKIGSLNDEIGNHNYEIGILKEKIGSHLEEISILENYNRETPYYWVNQWVKNNLKSYEVSFEDSLSQGQFDSKMWLITELKKIKFWNQNNMHIDIIGSWFGYPLIEMLNKIFKIKQIDLHEKDINCQKVFAQYMNHFDPNFRVVQFDDFFERKELRRRQLIINTSSEHMSDIVLMKEYFKDYPVKPIMAIQSNNYFEIHDHINCVKNEDELIEKNQIKKIYFKGKQELPQYDRFMVIGSW